MGSQHSVEVIARAAMFHGEHLLLCRSIPGGYSYLPGGHVEFGESAEAAAARELLEEAGITVAVGRCLHVHEQIFHQGAKLRHELNILFHVEQAGPDPAPGDAPPTVTSLEADLAFDWVKLSELGGVDLRPPAAAAWFVRFHTPRQVLESDTDWLRSKS